MTFAHATCGLRLLRVSRRFGGGPHEGRLVAGPLVLPCALGRGGVTHRKREGDGATPAGRWRLLRFYLRRPAPLRAPWRRTRRDDLWCDDAGSFLYNRPLRAPSRLSHEKMWRGDRLYDVVGVMNYNIVPCVRGLGSAIFLHIATDQLGPTAGCVALRARDMARLAPRLARGATIYVE
jgi:L,D-peptidoglycan transpeptidase YkuD (ErfK/YbiS/YcfS/YnhG family)